MSKVIQKAKPADTLTPRQQSILNWVKQYLSSKGYGPSIREICEQFEVNPNGAIGHLRALERKGAMKRGVKDGRALARAYVFPTEERQGSDA